MNSTDLIATELPKASNGNGAAPLIRLSGVTKVFLTDEVETHALSGIHLDIREGEYVSIAGPSGCGKSTLLSILGLLDTPSDGSYALKGHEVANLSFADRARIRNREIGFIFQSFNLIGDLTVFENVELPLTYRGLGAGERKELVTQALDRVGMAHRAARRSHCASVRWTRGRGQPDRGLTKCKIDIFSAYAERNQSGAARAG